MSDQHGKRITRKLQSISSRIVNSPKLDDTLRAVRADICSVFKADKIRIYKVDAHGRVFGAKCEKGQLGLISRRYRSSRGTITKLEMQERLVTEYVASLGELVNISNAYDDQVLSAFNPPVRFDKIFDEESGYRTRQLLVAPILDTGSGKPLGVVQVVNCLDEQPFPQHCEGMARELCASLAIAFRNERLATEALKAQAELGLREDVPEPHASAREQLLQVYRTRHAAFGCFDADSAGRNTWGAGDFEALGWICRLEATGHVGAARLLDRVKPPPDNALALAWYERGLAVGSTKGLSGWLSASVHGKLGLVPDPDTAFERVQRFIAAGGTVEAIGQHTVTAICEIGKSHLERNGAEADPALAAKWLQVGALLGDPVACYHLSMLYASGRGVTQDREVARTWLEKAQVMLARYQRGCELGSVKCLSRWLSACMDCKSVDAPDPDSVLKGVEQFIAAGGDVESIERSIRGLVGKIGKSHREGPVAEADLVRHAKWLQVGALLGDSGACGSLGLCYAYGRGVSRDPDVARAWLKRCEIMDEKLIEVVLDEADPASPNYIVSAPGTSAATPAQADAGSRDASQKLDFYRDPANVYASWEVETKLDLAKAYVEMGDAEGARELLVEVLDSGDDGQQARARELMKRC